MKLQYTNDRRPVLHIISDSDSRSTFKKDRRSRDTFSQGIESAEIAKVVSFYVLLK